MSITGVGGQSEGGVRRLSLSCHCIPASSLGQEVIEQVEQLITCGSVRHSVAGVWMPLLHQILDKKTNLIKCQCH